MSIFRKCSSFNTFFQEFNYLIKYVKIPVFLRMILMTIFIERITIRPDSTSNIHEIEMPVAIHENQA